ncbi:1-phosphofructokinase family hexose kinase [bacterium]|nr:1-phosphofructokinase family hexose kinase [bacterium]
MTAAPEPVLTVTLNPAIDLELHVDELRRGAVTRALGSARQAGGKGINVSRELARLGVRSAAAVALGGPDAIVFKELLGKPKFAVHAIAIRGAVRTNVTAGPAGRGYILKINEPGPEVSKSETGKIVREIGKLTIGRKWVVISGSLAPGMPPDTYARIVRAAHRHKAAVAIDCEGGPLLNAIAEKPELVRVNRCELSATIGRPLAGQAPVIEAMREVCRRGAKSIVVSDGPRTALAIDENGTLRKAAPSRKFPGRIVGAGDAMLARLIASLVDGESFCESFLNVVQRSRCHG